MTISPISGPQRGTPCTFSSTVMIAGDREKKASEPVDPEITGQPQTAAIDQGALRGALVRLDCFLLPVATFIYFLNFLDR